MIFLKNLKQKKKQRLVSFHIPKTAGTSFSEILSDQYGKYLYKIYEQPLLDDCKYGQIPFDDLIQYRAFHGHFPARTQWLEAFPDAVFITWIRDPLERLKSHYTFLQRIPVKGKIAQLFQKNQPSFLAFATESIYQPANAIYQTYLDNFPLNRLTFIGQTEHFDRDIKRFAKIMDWPEIPEIPKRNRAPKSFSIDSETEFKVVAALKAEYELYFKLIQIIKNYHDTAWL
ncbi:MAG: sulfotransferase family 2 domain-containing protein [Cryomorphaceae bacterium]|nr:sulfotransferase family 2 domain-containing protein [Cryomorphaceae bacterium]